MNILSSNSSINNLHKCSSFIFKNSNNNNNNNKIKINKNYLKSLTKSKEKNNENKNINFSFGNDFIFNSNSVSKSEILIENFKEKKENNKINILNNIKKIDISRNVKKIKKKNHLPLLLKNNSLKIKKPFENINTTNNSNILIKEKSHSLYNIHDSINKLNVSNKLPIILFSKKSSNKNLNILSTNSKIEYSPKFLTNNNESPNKLSPIKNYKKIININTYNNSNKINDFKNKRNFTYNFNLNNLNINNNNFNNFKLNNRYNFNLNNLDFDISKNNNFFTLINNNNSNNSTNFDFLNKKFYSNNKIPLISKSNNNLFTYENNKNNKSTIVDNNKKSIEKNSFSFNKTNKNDLISKLKSFNQKITIKILSKYNKNEIYKIENLKFFNNKEKEIFYLFCYLNNKLCDKIKNEKKFEKKNIFDFYFKLTDKIKFIKIKNNKNFGIKEIEIFKNKFLIFKGNIPNNNNEYKIFFKNDFSNKNSKINIQKVKNKNTIKENKTLNYKLIKTLSILNSKKKNKNNNSFKNIKNYIKCNKIKIILVSNYGNKNLIGLTGIQFIIKNNNNNNNNNNFCYFDIIKNNSILNIKPKNDSFMNLFTKNNLTTDENCMYETLNLNPSIEIIFNKIIYLHEIKFFNFNQPKNLDKCTKKLNIYFNEEKLPFEFYLHKGIGKNSIDFSQSFFPSNTLKQKIFLSDFELEPFKQIKHASLLYNQNYETPYLPSGFVLQFILLENWGDQNYIAFDDIKIFDQFGKEIKYNKSSHLKYMKFYNFRNQNNIKKINEYFIIFDNVVIISYIKIFNFKEDINKGIRRIIIKLDQKIIYEGYINKLNANLNGTTCILFTCDLNITKDIQENELPGYTENIESLKNRQNRKEIKTKKGRILKLI